MIACLRMFVVFMASSSLLMTAFLGEVPSPTRDEFQGFMYAGVALVGFIYLIVQITVGVKKLLETKKPEEQYVTKSELDQKLDSLLRPMGTQLTELKTALLLCVSKEEFKELQKDNKERFHMLANSLAPLTSEIKVVSTIVQMHEKQVADVITSTAALLNTARDLRTIAAELKEAKIKNVG